MGSRFAEESATYLVPFQRAGMLITRVGFACAGAPDAAQVKSKSAQPISRSDPKAGRQQSSARLATSAADLAAVAPLASQ